MNDSSNRRSEKLHQKREQLKKASELLRFSYNRSPDSSATGVVTPRKYNRTRGMSISKSQYVQANFKFILSPLMSPLESCLYEPDEAVPWGQVVCVILPHVADQKEACNDDSEGFSLDCPICLDDARIPKITSCGHIFCCTCILRHLSSGSRGSSKCPICAEFLCESDLKSVVSSLHSSESIRHKLKVDNYLEFTLLEVSKGFVAPQFYISPTEVGKSSHSNKLSLHAVIPNALDANAPYSRLAFITVDMMLDQFAKDRDSLLQYRHRCLQSSTTTNSSAYAPTESLTGDVESLPYIQQALDLLERSEVDFQRKLSQQPPDMSRSSEMESRRIDRSTIGLKALDSYSTGDEIMIDQLTTEALKGGGEQLDGLNSSADSVSKTSSTLKQSAVDRSISCSQSTYPIYQLFTGDLVFLHPICTRCLVESAVDRNGCQSSLPTLLRGRIIDIEYIRVTASNRQRYNVLRHLPLHCEVTLIEIDLVALIPALVSDHVLSNFREQLTKRSHLRKEKKRQMLRESKIEQDRKIAEDIQRSDQIEYSKRAEQFALEELLNGPTLSGHRSSTERAIEPATVQHSDNALVHRSFASITQMGGNFPTLADSVLKSPTGSGKVKTKAEMRPHAWGKSIGEPLLQSDTTSSVSNRATTASTNTIPTNNGDASLVASTKKKGRKTIVLMSNSSFRGVCR